MTNIRLKVNEETAVLKKNKKKEREKNSPISE